MRKDRWQQNWGRRSSFSYVEQRGVQTRRNAAQRTVLSRHKSFGEKIYYRIQNTAVEFFETIESQTGYNCSDMRTYTQFAVSLTSLKYVGYS